MDKLMLIEFTVGNFRSFKEPATLSLFAAKIKARDQKVNENNTFFVEKGLTLLTSSVIYGANASGKSNLVKAIAFMRKYVIFSAKESLVNEKIRVSPFRLSTATEHSPSFFQVIFLIEGVKYRYGFEASSERIISEWLFVANSTKETTLFTRDENGIKVSRIFKEGKNIQDKTRPNVLFLSAVSQWNGEISNKITNWFINLKVISGLSDNGYKAFTIQSFESGKFRDEIVKLVKNLDLGITDITSQKLSDEKFKLSLPNDIPDNVLQAALKDFESEKVLIQTYHKKFDTNGLPISDERFNLRSDESEGTKKLFFLAGPLLDVLQNGSVLFIDELEARLHPLMSQAIIGLFNSKETNPKNAQIVLTTHDTNLLSNKVFRRDQIWFIEKDHFGCAHLYSLAELQVRNDASYEDNYIEGRYGAIPFLGDIQRICIED